MQGIPEGDYLKYYYCNSCSEILQKKSKKKYKCPGCRKVTLKKKLDLDETFFIYAPLEPQLKNIVQSELYTEFRQECEESDVVNGSVYKQLKKDGIIGDKDITLQFNTDGLKIKKGSKKSSWAVLGNILELPARLRNKNIILNAFWYGPKKPDMNLYLRPLAEELKRLNELGFNTTTFTDTEEINIKVHTLIFTVDSVARPLLQNVNQYNGKYGCPYCLNKGKRIPVGRGHARIYEYKECDARTYEQHLRFLEKVRRTKKIVKGVKGPSILSIIPSLNIIYGFPPDYMHCCLEGVTKMFTLAWFDPQYENSKFYIGKKKQEFNERLKNILPPHEMTRVPRDLDKDYKASEWKHFLINYSEPCLKGILPQRYLNHWHLFASAIRTLLQMKVSDKDIELAEKSLKQFVKETQTLYGERFMTFNLHLLTHTPGFVKDYGALWAWSTFCFEGFNGVIKTLHNGTQYIPNQIFYTYFRLAYLKSKCHIFASPNVHPDVLDTFLRTMTECQVTNCLEYEDNLRVFGKENKLELDNVEKYLVRYFFDENVQIKRCNSYKRFIQKNILYHSDDYQRFQKRKNSLVMMKDGNIVDIKNLIEISDKFLVLGVKLEKTNEVVCKYGPISSAKYSYVVTRSREKVCYEVSSIEKKCVLIPYENEKYCVTTIVNTIETD